MDSGRLGRVLGAGARGAAKTLISAVDAASADNPRAHSPRTSPHPATRPAPQVIAPAGPPTHSPGPSAQASRSSAQKRTATRPTTANLAEGGRRFGQAIWSPITRLSGVLWLEFTGVFFGLFALFAGLGAWKQRAALHALPGNPARTHFLLALAVAVVFTYFCVSSFIRASRRGRRA